MLGHITERELPFIQEEIYLLEEISDKPPDSNVIDVAPSDYSFENIDNQSQSIQENNNNNLEYSKLFIKNESLKRPKKISKLKWFAIGAASVTFLVILARILKNGG